MKRLKYQPREGENHGENKIKEEWLKEQFGQQFKLIWNGHSHFALDGNTGEMYYIFKTRRYLYPVHEFWQYNTNCSKKYPIKDETKTFCDICGKELTSLEELNVYCVSIVKQHKMGYAPLTRKYPEVCEDCTKKIVKFIDDLEV